MNGLSSERDELRRALETATAETEAATTAVADLEARLQQVTAERAELDSSLQASRSELQDQASAAETFKQRSQALQGEVMRIATVLGATDREARQRQAALREQQAKLAGAADQLNELSRFRSAFFGRLVSVLGTRSDVAVVGDRFVFQAEVLFDSGSAELDENGVEQLDRLATALKDVAAQIPPEVDWILRVDGHTDKVPIQTAAFGSNWDLSAARAISVVDFLVSRGIPSNRLSANAFGEFHPMDDRDTPDAYRQNRRIELKLTGR
jgi:chemotaxis protein MotB